MSSNVNTKPRAQRIESQGQPEANETHVRAVGEAPDATEKRDRAPGRELTRTRPGSRRRATAC